MAESDQVDASHDLAPSPQGRNVPFLTDEATHGSLAPGAAHTHFRRAKPT